MAEPRDPPAPEPLERLSLEAAELMRRHPPVLADANKRALFAIACPDGAVHAGRLDYSRWPEMPLRAPRPGGRGRLARLLAVRDGHDDYRPILDAAAGVEWHVNFADGDLFFGYGSGLFAQDEVQVAEHPILGSLREALLARGLPATTMAGGRPTPVLVAGAERRIRVQTAPAPGGDGRGALYGRAFARASADAVRAATTRLDPPAVSNIVAIAAPSGGSGRYRRDEIGLALATAYSGFRAAVLESGRMAGPGAGVAVHSGFWGCGAFGGNRVMMTLLQILAADLAGLARLVLHVAGPDGRADVGRALALAEGLATAPDPSELIARAEGLGLAWGVGDGN